MPPTRVVLDEFGAAGEAIAARVLDRDGGVVAVVIEPARPVDLAALRDAVVTAALGAEVGGTILAGVAFADHLGGDAVGFT